MQTIQCVLVLLLLCCLQLTLCQTSFSNATMPIWAPAPIAAKFVLLRPPTVHLNETAARMKVLVSAAQDNKDQQQVLALYRLFVNGMAVGMGPGRGEVPVSLSSHNAIFDTIDVPQSALGASVDGKTFSVALQCWHPDGGTSAWVMLQAQWFNKAGRVLSSLHTTDSDWFSHNADEIFKQGELDTGGGHYYVNEDIDARQSVNVSNWRLPQFDPSLWAAAEQRTVLSAPVAKTSLPLVVQSGLLPIQLLQLSNGTLRLEHTLLRDR